MAFAAKYGNANILRYFNVNYELDYNEIVDNARRFSAIYLQEESYLSKLKDITKEYISAKTD